MTKARFAAVSTLFAGILLVVAWQGRARWLPALSSWLDDSSPPRQVDVILALPGDIERRPFVAATFAKAGFARRLLIVRNPPSPDVIDGVADPTHAVVRRIYEARGIAPDRIIDLRGASTSTADDVAQLADYLKAHPTLQAGVVTNAYHARRTRWTLRKTLPEIAHRVDVFAAPNPRFTDRTWWQSPWGFRAVVSEYLKSAAYLVWYAPAHVAVFLVAAVVIWLVSAVFRRFRFAKQ